MKAQWIGIPIVSLLIAGCGAFSSEPAHADETLAEKSGCLECHAIASNATTNNADKQVSGPSFHDIAAKYKGNASARSGLIQVVKKGGKGKWPSSGGVPMPPYSPRLNDAEIQRLVDWVLRL